MSRKSRNHINVPYALDLMINGYGLNAKKFNYYQIRIWCEEKTFDWYHTTGSLVMLEKGFFKKMGVMSDPEDVAIIIKKEIEEIT